MSGTKENFASVSENCLIFSSLCGDLARNNQISATLSLEKGKETKNDE
jgi:hypothetical protein